MKNYLAGAIIVIILITALAGFSFAQTSPTYVPPPDPPDPTFPDPPPLPTPRPEPDLPDECIRFNMLDKHEIFLTPGGQETLTATVPERFAPYQITWYSQDTSIATVTAMSQAVVTAQNLGSTWVVVRVETEDGDIYCDAAAVYVQEAEELVPTPPTGGLHSAHYALLGLVLLFAVLPLSRKLAREK